MNKLLIAALITSTASAANLDNFSAFVGSDINSPLAFFADNWAGAGPANENVGFIQQVGSYDFAAGTNSADAYVDKYVAADFSAVSYGQISQIAVTAKILAGNAAPSFTLTLFDAVGNQASATFAASDFTTNFTTVTKSLSSSGLNLASASLDHYRIGGDVPGGSAAFRVSFDNIDIMPTAVPEPSSYALLGGVVSLAFAVSRRTRRVS